MMQRPAVLDCESLAQNIQVLFVQLKFLLSQIELFLDAPGCACLVGVHQFQIHVELGQLDGQDLKRHLRLIQ